MICHFRDGEGIIHDIPITSEITVIDIKKTIEKIMLREYIISKDQKKFIASSFDGNNPKLLEKINQQVTPDKNLEEKLDENFKDFSNNNHASNENEKESLQDLNKEASNIANSDNANITSYREKKTSLSLFKYRRDLFKIQYKMYTLFNDQKLNELDIKEGDLFILTPLPTIKIFLMLPINSTKYFNQIFKPQFLEYKDQIKNSENRDINGNEINNDNNNNNNDNDNSNDKTDLKIKSEKLKIGVNWMKKTGWTIGPIAIPYMTNCALTLLNALEAVFNAKTTNIKVFDCYWNEVRTLSSINPIIKDNVIFGVYIRNQIEETMSHPNKNFTAWTNVFKYKYYNLPTRSKSSQVLQSNSKLQVLIAQPIPQELPKAKNNDIDFPSNSIPLFRSRSGPIKESQIPLQKKSSLNISPKNAESQLNKNIPRFNIVNIIANPSSFYHPVPVFFQYSNNKKVLACFNSDEILTVQLLSIKKDLGIPESTKISIEFNDSFLDLNSNPEDLKIIEFSTMKIVTSGSCILI